MCLSNPFKRAKQTAPLTLPFPEEPRDPTANIATTSARGLLALWLLKYRPADPAFWQTLDLSIVDTLDHPAETISELKQVRIQPSFASPGVLAHELAHISYSLLSEQEKVDFAMVADTVKSDPLVALMLEQKPNARKNIIEKHADLYRFLGKQLPESLRAFYPALI